MTDVKITKHTLVIQQKGNIVSDMNGEKVMLSIQSGKYFNLGKTGGEIWEKIKEPISIHELVTNIQAQYDVNKDECEQQVTAFLNQLIEEELVIVEEKRK